jgi:type IV secretion system protein VirD4
VRPAGNSGNKFFDDYAKNLLQALVMWEKLTKRDAANLRNIRGLIQADDTFPNMVLSKNRVVREMGIDVYKRLTDKNSQSTGIRDGMETLKNNLAFLNDARIEADMARGGAIDFAALHRTITTIYLILPPGQLKEQARWLRLFVNLALRKMYEAAPSDEAPPTLPPVLVALDEFGNVGRLEEIIKALNMARYSRLQLLFFLQNIDQLNAYKNETGSFFSGAGATTTFKTGGIDTTTAGHLAKAFGNQEMLVTSESRTGGSVKPEAIPLIRPEDIARLPPNTTISMIEPCPWPVLANAPIYRHTRFNEGLAPHPYHHA